MQDDNLKWYFPKAENVSGRGENDPQKELFPGDPCQTLIRESIQNSLDHPLPDGEEPVRVEFTLRKYTTDEFVIFNKDLREHIQSCYDISKADKFKRMLDVLKDQSFFMLEISDYNTIGMDYDYQSDKGRFKKFVRYTGDPNDVAGSGGSHGYGKITYFSVSEINTLIVSTMTADGVCTFEGVSRLATHPASEPRWSYYDTGFLDSGNGVPVQCQSGVEGSIIPVEFRRNEIGTTVYIPFFNIDDIINPVGAVFKTCCEAVLRNFFAAISDGTLEVRIDFSVNSLFPEDNIFECNKENIGDIFANRFFNNPPYDTYRRSIFDKFNPYPYWMAYCNCDVEITDEVSQEEAVERCVGKKFIRFKKELDILGRVTFSVNVDIQRGNDVVLFMRCPRMVVMAQRNNTSRGYSAIFLCDDARENKGNDLLRLMEDAAHRTWSKRQLLFDKRPQEKIEQASQIEIEMREFIRQCLDIIFPPSQNDSDDVELEDFTIPLISENDTTNPLIGSLINIKGNDDESIGAPVDIHAGPVLLPKKSNHIGKAQVIMPKKVHKTNTDTDITGGGGGGNRNGKKKHHEEDAEGEEKIVRMKLVVKYRIFYEETDNGQTLYTLIIHSPQQEDNAYLTLIPVGETDDKSCNVHIQSTSIGKIRENEISEVPLAEGKNVITFTVDNSGEYAFSLLAEHDVTIIE